MLSNILCKHDLVTLYDASCGCIITVNLLIAGLWEFFIYIKLTLWYAIVNLYLIIVSGWDFRHRINRAKERNFCGTVSIMAVCFPLEIVPVFTLNIFQVLNENFFFLLPALMGFLLFNAYLLRYWWSWAFLYIYWTFVFIFLRIACCYFDHFSIEFKDFFHLINLYQHIIDWWLLSFIMNV